MFIFLLSQKWSIYNDDIFPNKKSKELWAEKINHFYIDKVQQKHIVNLIFTTFSQLKSLVVKIEFLSRFKTSLSWLIPHIIYHRCRSADKHVSTTSQIFMRCRWREENIPGLLGVLSDDVIENSGNIRSSLDERQSEKFFFCATHENVKVQLWLFSVQISAKFLENSVWKNLTNSWPASRQFLMKTIRIDRYSELSNTNARAVIISVSTTREYSQKFHLSRHGDIFPGIFICHVTCSINIFQYRDDRRHADASTEQHHDWISSDVRVQISVRSIRNQYPSTTPGILGIFVEFSVEMVGKFLTRQHESTVFYFSERRLINLL